MFCGMNKVKQYRRLSLEFERLVKDSGEENCDLSALDNFALSQYGCGWWRDIDWEPACISHLVGEATGLPEALADIVSNYHPIQHRAYEPSEHIGLGSFDFSFYSRYEENTSHWRTPDVAEVVTKNKKRYDRPTRLPSGAIQLKAKGRQNKRLCISGASRGYLGQLYPRLVAALDYSPPPELVDLVINKVEEYAKHEMERNPMTIGTLLEAILGKRYVYADNRWKAVESAS